MRFYGLPHLPESVAERLIRGLEDGSLTLGNIPDDVSPPRTVGFPDLPYGVESAITAIEESHRHSGA